MLLLKALLQSNHCIFKQRRPREVIFGTYIVNVKYAIYFLNVLDVAAKYKRRKMNKDWVNFKSQTAGKF